MRSPKNGRRTKQKQSMKNEATLLFVRDHRDDDVRRLAFAGDKHPDVDMAWALDQISGWQTARRKLPSWATCEGVVYPPHLNMEQCSSEQTGHYKADLVARLVGARTEGDRRLVDLTGGFGVDFSLMAPVFTRATYVERNEALCDMARHNFPLLGLRHAEVVCGDGTQYLQSLAPVNPATSSDSRTLIYLDPARRDSHGRKVFGMEDCTPDVVALGDALLQRADVVLVKLSPMLDWHEAVRKLPSVAEVHIVSVANECKELLLVLSREEQPLRVFCVNDGQTFSYHASAAPSASALPAVQSPQVLLVPNSSVMKAGCFRELETTFGVPQIGADAHLFVAAAPVPNFPGRQFRILRTTSMNKRQLREAFHDVSQANVAVRHFPLTADALRRRLKLKDGGSLYVFATTVGHDHRLFLTEKMPVD